MSINSVIDVKSISNHVVQKYNFKILSSSTHNQEEQIADNKETAQEESVQNTQNEELSNVVPKEVKDDFIAELLEKSDKMSSELVKLQMQIEEGQKEFEQRVKEVKEESYAKGLEDGYNKAKQEYESEFETLKKQYTDSVSKLDETTGKCKEYMDSLKSELTDVSLEIAKEVIAKEVSDDSKEIALALAKKLLDDIKDANKIEIKVNPKDFEFLKKSFSNMHHITVSSDDAINEGGVILISNIGNIDGDLKTRVEKAKHIIMVK